MPADLALRARPEVPVLLLALLPAVALAADPVPPRVSADALVPLAQPLPAYPRALIGRAVPEVLTCEVTVVVETDGLPSAVKAGGAACPPEAAAEAEAAVRGWRWQPPRKVDGTVLRVETTLRLRFRQQGPATTTVPTPPAATAPACAVEARIDRRGAVLQATSEPEDCRPTTSPAPAPLREVPPATVCRLALDAAYGRALRLRFEDCPADAQPWAAQVTRGWSWWRGETPRTVHLTLTVVEP